MKRVTYIHLLLFAYATAGLSQQPHIANVLCSLNDSEGLWWYGTQGGGLFRDNGGKLTAFRADREHPDLLRSNDVTCLAECRTQHEIWFGTKQGAYILNKEKDAIRELLPDELGDMRINCMLESRSSMWLAYRNQLLQFDAKNDSVLRRFELTWQNKNRAVCALSEDRSGTIWLALWNGGLCRMVRNANAFEPCEWTRDDYCTSLQYDSVRNCMLVETSTGEHLIVRKGETRCVPDIDMGSILHEMLVLKGPHSDQNILSWAEVSDSLYYIGTYHSLYYYDMRTDSLLRLNLETDRVRDIAVSKDGNIYFLSKAMGVCRLKGTGAEVLCASNAFRSVEMRGDTLLWLTDGIGNTSTLDLRTKVLTTLDPPLVQDQSSSRGKIWLLIIPLAICALGLTWWWKRKHKEEGEAQPVAEQTLSPSEEEFLQRIIQHINEHISDEGYGIRALSGDMCMSRVNLYRKVRSLTGQSPTDFISNHRLERAAELLRTTNYTVNEVADMVGFSYATYFTRCFKERFGVAPKDYR